MPNLQNEESQNARAEALLATLTQRQYLRPHMPLNIVLAQLDVCSVAIEQSIRWLKMDESRAIGRFRAAELSRLSRCIQRLWDNARSQDTLAPQTV